MAPSNVENFSPNVIKQISRELCDLTQNPLEGVRVVFNEDDITSVQADIDGPPGTPYYGGSFRVRLVLGKNFPISPPKGFFVTKIFHPNVGRNGEICVNTLKKDWNQDLGIKHILLTIKCLLIVPNPESALNEEAGKMLLEQYDDYCKRAKMMTEIHAPRAKTSVESCVDSQNGSTIDCGGQQSSASSSSVAGVIINGNNAGIHSNSNNNSDPTTATTTNTTTTAASTTAATTLYDKTASSSTSANTYGAGANSGGVGVGGGGIKHPLDEVCCSEEPVTKRLNSILDCYNPTADQQTTQQVNNHPSSLQQPNVQQNRKGPSIAGAKAASGANAGTSNKNRGLKRVLRLRS